jgi:hypothetical protein
VEPTDTSEDAKPTWTSALQLRQFRENAETIAEAYLKSTGLKLNKGRKRKPTIYDRGSYMKGWEDGKKVDLKRRRIEGKDWTDAGEKKDRKRIKGAEGDY